MMAPLSGCRKVSQWDQRCVAKQLLDYIAESYNTQQHSYSKAARIPRYFQTHFQPSCLQIRFIDPIMWKERKYARGTDAFGYGSLAVSVCLLATRNFPGAVKAMP